jgi:hypothetical protein
MKEEFGFSPYPDGTTWDINSDECYFCRKDCKVAPHNRPCFNRKLDDTKLLLGTMHGC